MNKKIITIGVLMMGGIAFSQVGVGIKQPHKSTLLHLENKKDDYKGVFIPNVPLKGLKDGSLINNGNILTSLLVYNTENQADVTPGFYYWKANEWVRVIDHKDILENLDNFPKNKTLAVKKENNIDVLYVEDTQGHMVSVPLKDINIVTTLIDGGNGKYVFTNEEGTQTTIDIPNTVVENITEILNQTTVKQEIYETVAVQGKKVSSIDGSIQVDNGDKAALNAMQISIAKGGVTPEKIEAGGNKQILITNSKGEVVWVDASDEVIIDAVKNNETVTVLVDKGDGTFEYYNEKAIDANGDLIQANAVKFNANTLSIVERQGKEQGIYDFFDGEHKDTPLMTISTRANSIYFDNSSTTIKGDNLQEVIENIITKIEVAQGTPSSIKGGREILINGETELGEAVLKEMTLSIAPGAITTEKIEAGGNKQILITNSKGEVVWVDASDEVIIDAVKNNETVTVLVDKGDGTFEYYNEKAIDANGDLIQANAVKFNANTLSIVERQGKEQGIYDFFDGEHKDTPLMTISTRANSIYFDNSSTTIKGDNLQEVIENIITKIEVAQGTPSSIKGGREILINGETELGEAVLKEMTLSIAPGAITTEKIEAGGNKQILITNSKGEVVWVDASDEVIIDAVKNNETVTVLVDKGDGTFEYYNEKAIDANGDLIQANAVKFNANTLSIVEVLGENQNGTGVFNFYDKSQETPIATINVPESVINNIVEILNDESVVNVIYDKVAAKGKAVTSVDGSIHIDNGDKAALNAMQISIADGGVTPKKIAAGGNKQILITNAEGNVVWVDASDKVIIDAVKNNETVTVLVDKGDGTFEYYNEKAIDANGDLIQANAVKFNANTLSIVERQGKEQGIYDFFDGEHKDTPLMTISTRANSIYFDNSSTTIKGDNLQEVIENIITKIEVAQGTPSSIKGGREILINGETELGEAVLKEMTLSIAPGAITTEKIEAGGKKQILITNSKGEVVWVDASDEVIIDAVKNNETVTVLVDKGDGTFEYYNEKAIDANGDLIQANAVKFNANTLSIIEVLGENQNGTGVFNFYDKSQETPIATINVPESVINNIVEILNDESVVNVIYDKVAAKGKAVTSVDGSIHIDNGDKAALNAMQISIADGGVTPKKIEAGGNKQILITNAEGNVVWVDASDEVIIDAVQKNERITHLEVKEDGTFIYYNELAVNEKGEIIAEGVAFDANTLSIEESTNTPGIFTFSDKKGVIKDLDIRASKIIIDDSTIGSGNDNVQDILETIFEIINNIDSQKRDLKGNGILVNGKTIAEKAVLADLELSIADNAITTSKLGTNAVTTEKVVNHAITEDKLWAGEGREKQVAVVQVDGSVKFQELNAVVTGKMLSVDNSLLVKGDASKALLQAVDIKVNDLGIVTKHIDHNAVTAAKIGSEEAVSNEVLTANGSGGSVFMPISSVVDSAMQGDIQGDDAIIVTGGENVVFGDNQKKTSITLNNRGVKGGHIATQTILNENIANTTITATKLNGEADNVNAVATVIDKKGTVAYQPLKADAISDKAALKTDGIIMVGGLDQQGGTLLKEATLSIASKGINTTQIADNAVDNLQIANLAVSSDKITSGTVGTGRVLLSDVDGKTKWGELDDITTQLAGDLTTDEIIKLTSQDGEGKKALLKDVKLSINDNSITKSKLSSVEADGNVDEDMLLVADGQGGFKYIKKETVSIETEDLVLGSALTFINKSTGKDAVLVNTSIDVMEGGINTLKLADAAVTIDKITSGIAKQNTVLTAIGNGKVEYKKLSNSAFEGSEANLLSDGSLLIPLNNKAVLTETTIGIAKSGVQTQHIAARAVTVDKIGAEGTSNGLVLVTKDGGAEFTSLSEAVAGTGKDIKEGSAIKITNGAQAALKDVTIEVKDLGITNAKIAERTIQASKFDATGNAPGTVLTSLGDGEAKYVPLNQYAKPLKADSSIKISTDNGVLLADATIKVNDSGIDTKHLGAKVVTTDKISSKLGNGVANEQQILMADGKGGVYFGTSENVVTKGNINEGATISATKGATGAVLQDVTLEVKGLSINTEHIKDNAISQAKINAKAVTEDKIDTNAVTETKIASKAVTENKIADKSISDTKIKDLAIRKNHIYIQNIEEKHLASNAVSTRAIANNAVTTEKIANDNVTNYKIKDGAVTTNKISAEDASVGHVLTVEKDGKVAFKAATGQSVTKGKLTGSGPIYVDNGVDAVLKDVTLDISGKSIKTEHIADRTITKEKIGFGQIYNEHITTSAVDSKQIKNGAVQGDIIKDKGVETEKISSYGANEYEVLTSDGRGGARWEKISGTSDTGSGDLKESNTIEIAEGEGKQALFNDLKLEIKGGSIQTKHIADNAVGTDELKDKSVGFDQLQHNSVYNEVIHDYGIKASKMNSEDDRGKDTPEGYVLTSDGNGGAHWEQATNGNGGSDIASPKFFYLPAIYVEMVSGQSNSIELYDEYKEQFGSPMLSSNGSSTLPVYDQDDLNYYVTYYDKNVFENVRLDSDGELHYTVKQGAKPTGRTFFNIVLEVKQ
ncbi:hypothetical protein LNQ81_00140 [Myroides sp. M-43]|uniref:hypothetical protein n=1 Tax=Myroides oncorhynchi TaxID=2893756 RepID=UPI001E4AB87C|nr:hypothetical protein [Myroides oncorhynchi]MCC9041148.1 hypothetical protein [Myroides oncorhynchi]